MKTSELQGVALDWAVTKCEGYDHEVTPGSVWGKWGWATDWAQGGPIIEREEMTVSCHWQHPYATKLLKAEKREIGRAHV